MYIPGGTVIRSFTSTVESKVALNLPQKEKDGSVTFADVIKQVPELNDGSMTWLNPRLFNGHLQTIQVAQKDPNNLVYYGRRLVTFRDGSTISADYALQKPKDLEAWTEDVKYIPEGAYNVLPPRTRYFSPEELTTLHPETEDGGASLKPLVVGLHGITGGSHEAYLRAVVAQLIGPEVDFETVILNSRGCNFTKLTTPELFCGLMTDDIRRFLKIVRDTQPKRRIFAVGYSLGASILANYIGQEGKAGNDSLLDAACVVACPWDYVYNGHALSQSFVGSRAYDPLMGRNLVRLIKRNANELKANPIFENWEEKAKEVTTIRSFDERFTAPAFGFDTASAYYRAASPDQRAMDIRTPCLIVHAMDDPIAGYECVPKEDISKNPFLFCVATNGGGHLGWFTAAGGRWHAKPIAQFFKAYHDTVSLGRSDYDHSVKMKTSMYKDGRLVLRSPDLEEI